MSVAFHDYYSTLGIARDASEQEIRRAYRRLARETHPDVDRTTGSKERFQRLNEAYEVLKDPQTRARYDALGPNWREGQEFTPPAGFDTGRGRRDRGARSRASSREPTGFSSFFETFFADAFGGEEGDGVFEFHDDERHWGSDREGPPPTLAEWPIPLEQIARGGTCTVRWAVAGDGADASSTSTRTLDVTLPRGTTEGTLVRLRGQGLPTARGPSDLWLRVRVAPHERFRVEGHDLHTRVKVEPPVGVLGGEVQLRDLAGRSIALRVPRGSPPGHRMRLRGLGLERPDGTRGDLIAELEFVTPVDLGADELELYERLRVLARRRAS